MMGIEQKVEGVIAGMHVRDSSFNVGGPSSIYALVLTSYWFDG
jgi:hypothetical protein